MTESSPDGAGRRTALAVWAGLVLLGVVFVAHVQAWAFLCDDAYISFRYARNLAESGQLVFNLSPHPPVEGYTNFLWVIVLALASVLGAAPPIAAPVLTAVSGVAVLVLATLLIQTLRGTPLRATDLVAATLMCVAPEFIVWGSGGLEGMFALMWVLGAILAWEKSRWIGAALCAAAAGLTRPDALLPVAAYGLCWLVVRPKATRWMERLPRRKIAIAFVWFAAPLVAHLVWRRLYYDAWLPNTWAVKSHGHLLRDTWGVAYIQAWGAALHVIYLAPLLLLLRRDHAPMVCAGVATLAYGWWVGGDFMAYGRFLLPATAAVAVAIGLALGRGGDLLARWLGPNGGAIAVASIAYLFVVLLGRDARSRWEVDMGTKTGWLDGRWEGVATMDRFARVRVAAGEWFAERLPPDTLVMVGAAGAMPYGSRLPTYDAYGLVDAELARRPGIQPRKNGRPGHQLQASPTHVGKRDPDLLCHVGYHGARPPADREARRPYRRGHAWACANAGAIEDPRSPTGTIDAGYYCCRRPQDRVVGPFGARVPHE